MNEALCNFIPNHPKNRSQYKHKGFVLSHSHAGQRWPWAKTSQATACANHQTTHHKSKATDYIQWL